MHKIAIVNGPNLNLIGTREPEIYGHLSFDIFYQQLKIKYPHVEFSYYQSNVEGEIINKLHELMLSAEAVIINAGGYTHTSVAIADAIKAIKIPVVEVHISNILSRETFRHTSLIGPYCVGSIMGFGFKSYELAVKYFIDK